MDGAPFVVVALAKGNGKNNRRSLGFARDDRFFGALGRQCENKAQTRRMGHPADLYNFQLPVFEGVFEGGHEFAGVGAVYDAVIEAEAVGLHRADGYCVAAFCVR